MGEIPATTAPAVVIDIDVEALTAARDRAVVDLDRVRDATLVVLDVDLRADRT